MDGEATLRGILKEDMTGFDRLGTESEEKENSVEFLDWGEQNTVMPELEKRVTLNRPCKTIVGRSNFSGAHRISSVLRSYTHGGDLTLRRTVLRMGRVTGMN